MPIDTVIRRRRSTRHFDTDVEIPFEKLSTLLDTSMRGVASDALDPNAPPMDDSYLIVNNVAGLERGTYAVDPAGRGLELLKRGDHHADAAFLACDQPYAGDAHVNIYYLANLEPILERYGNRGYRLAQLEASLFAGKLHLATHALGLGAVGSTSMDDAVTDFFSPHAAGKSFMFILTFGQRRRNSAG
jgi:SagB-type dehydrogenase family enzyme